jgi:hypothetical protein
MVTQHIPGIGLGHYRYTAKVVEDEWEDVQPALDDAGEEEMEMALPEIAIPSGLPSEDQGSNVIVEEEDKNEVDDYGYREEEGEDENEHQ